MKAILLNKAPLSMVISGTDEPLVEKFKRILMKRIEKLVPRSVLGIYGAERLERVTVSGPVATSTVIAIVNSTSPQGAFWFNRLKSPDPLDAVKKEFQGKVFDFADKRIAIRNEAIAILSRTIDGVNYICVFLADPRSAGLGCGWLLNCLHYEDGKIYYKPLDGYLDQIVIPSQHCRGHMLATHFWSQGLDNMTLPMWQEYSEDLALMGVNLLMHVPMHAEEWTRMHFKNGQFTFEDQEIEEKFLPYWNVQLRLPEMWKSLGLDCGIWLPPNDVLAADSRWPRHLDGSAWCDNACPSDPEERKMILDLRRHLFANLTHLDILLIPAGDTGACFCSKCTPWAKTYFDITREVAALAKQYHPKVKLIVTNQKVLKSEMDTWYENLLKNEDVVDYICVSPGSDRCSDLIARSLHRFPVFSYMDITHCSLDAEYLRTFGDKNPGAWRLLRTYSTAHLEVVPYSQLEFYRRMHRVCGETEATAPYSEGIHDDINKFLWTLLDINPNLTDNQVLSMYARQHLKSDHRWDQLCHALEANLFTDPLINKNTRQALNLAKEMDQDFDLDIHAGFRWPMFLLRAHLDHYMSCYYQAGDAFRLLIEKYRNSEYLPQICQMLLSFMVEPQSWPRPVDIYGGAYNEYPWVRESANPRSSNASIWPKPAGARKSFIAEQAYPLPAGFIKEIKNLAFRIDDAYKCRRKVECFREQLREKWALEIEAAARVTNAITSIDWAKSYLEQIAYSTPDSVRIQEVVDHVLNPESSPKGGFYDDCGRKYKLGQPYDPSRQADLLCVHLERFSEETIFATDLDLANRDSQEVRAYGLSPGLKMRYEKLSSAATYMLRITYVQNQESTRFQSLWANGVCLHKPMLLPQRIAKEFTFNLEKDTYSDGKLELLFKYEGGFPENAVVSEVWLAPI